jgi:hypothetical protein
MTNYSNKLENLRSRRQDIITKSFWLSESFNRQEYGDSTKYALESMKPISDTYTQNTYKVCERIKAQLKLGLKEYGIDIDFKYQGSVPTNTHIKLYSDIDLLTIHGNFYSLQHPQVPSTPYEGDPLDDLKNLRRKTFRILDTVYTGCEINDTGSKCISISGGSLNRKIDIISSNWYNSLSYTQYPNEINRGIQILDRDKGERILNYPFLHIHRINTKDERVNGNEKSVIRLLKSLKVDADTEIKVSSYDIASLVYNMDDQALLVNDSQRLKLLENTNTYLLKVVNDSTFRQKLDVANGTRKIFCSNGAKVEDVSMLQKELHELILSIAGELKPIYDSLEKSNFYY